MEASKKALRQNIRDTFSALFDIFKKFKQEQLDISPRQGSWSAGQVAEHLTKGMSGMPKLANGRTEKTARQIDEKVSVIHDVFLDFETKLKSPDFLQPTATFHSKEKQLAAFIVIENELMEVSHIHDLSLICLDFEIPGFGPFTIYEWITFSLAHAQRHTQQFHRIYNTISTMP